MKEGIKYSIQKLKDAVASLKSGVSQVKDDLDKDGVIQRFEFTFELLWKCLKIVLGHEGIECKTPRDCFKSGFRVGIVEDEKTCLDMLEDRNKLPHIYHKEQSEKIFQKIQSNYASYLEQLLRKLESRVTEEKK